MLRDEHMGEARPVNGGREAADDRDAEGTAYLPDRVIDSAPRTGLARWHVVMMVVMAGAITIPMPAPMIASARAIGG